jgi:hypothetical protein
MTEIQNRGTGAGGANANINGRTFEERTENETRLLASGFIKHRTPGFRGKYAYYLEKEISPTQKIYYVTQTGLKSFLRFKLNKETFRRPDEAYILQNGDTYTLKILEKKNQHTEGSVDTKLLAGQGFIDEYKFLLGENIKVNYAFCISDFLKEEYFADTQKGTCLRYVTQKHGIPILFGEDSDYFEKLDAWINS